MKRHTVHQSLTSTTITSCCLLLASLPAPAFAEGAVAPAPEPPSLHAPDEERLMASHPVEGSKAHFKPSTGLVVESADGDFALAPRLRAQLRYTLEEDKGTEAVQSLQIRRARLQFKGHVYGKDNKFKVEIAISPRDIGVSDTSGPSTTPLLDWYWDFTHIRDLRLRAGQYKVPHNRQRLVSSGDLQMVDRSIVNSEFNLDRDLGLSIGSHDLGGLDSLRYDLGVFTGEGKNTRGFYDFGMTYVARFEVLPFGMFKDKKEGDFSRSLEPRLGLGVSYARVENARRSQATHGSVPADGGTTDMNSLAADAMFKMAGFSVSTEWMLRSGSRDPGGATEPDDMGMPVAIPTEDPREGYGGMLQVGYLFPRSRLELSARGGIVRPIGDDTSLTEEDEYGVGLSYYFAQHPFKLQGDYFRLGAERDDGGKNFINQVRVQLQVSY